MRSQVFAAKSGETGLESFDAKKLPYIVVSILFSIIPI